MVVLKKKIIDIFCQLNNFVKNVEMTIYIASLYFNNFLAKMLNCFDILSQMYNLTIF